ncbi:MAG: hypothetical protein JSW27_19195 [Phycisphaerales bacterium]|nr:MAG: hypothetical protein JSW27_19195 [Phycisphaerales bacterium]
MARQLTERERRMLIIGALSAVAILGLKFGLDGLDRWRAARTSLQSARDKLDEVAIDETKQAGLLSIVPVLEMPQLEEKQKFLFRERLHEQLKKAGIKTEPLTILSSRRKANIPYKVMRIKCTGKCKFEQLLDFLAALPENPYLVGVEELRVDCDATKPADKRKEVEIDLTVSTFVRLPKAQRAN